MSNSEKQFIPSRWGNEPDYVTFSDSIHGAYDVEADRIMNAIKLNDDCELGAAVRVQWNKYQDDLKEIENETRHQS